MAKTVRGFRKWLRQFEKDNTPIGDLARDVKLDNKFPVKGGLAAITWHLSHTQALDTLLKAWYQYKAEAPQ